MMKERSEYSTSYTNREDYSKYSTMQIQCLLLADGTKPLNIQIPQPLLKQLVYRSSIESSFDWFDSPSQVKRKKKAKAKNNQNFDTMMSNEFSFIFISTLDFRHTVQSYVKVYAIRLFLEKVYQNKHTFQKYQCVLSHTNCTVIY